MAKTAKSRAVKIIETTDHYIQIKEIRNELHALAESLKKANNSLRKMTTLPVTDALQNIMTAQDYLEIADIHLSKI